MSKPTIEDFLPQHHHTCDCYECKVAWREVDAYVNETVEKGSERIHSANFSFFVEPLEDVENILINPNPPHSIDCLCEGCIEWVRGHYGLTFAHNPREINVTRDNLPINSTVCAFVNESYYCWGCLLSSDVARAVALTANPKIKDKPFVCAKCAKGFTDV